MMSRRRCGLADEPHRRRARPWQRGSGQQGAAAPKHGFLARSVPVAQTHGAARFRAHPRRAAAPPPRDFPATASPRRSPRAGGRAGCAGRVFRSAVRGAAPELVRGGPIPSPPTSTRLAGRGEIWPRRLVLPRPPRHGRRRPRSRRLHGSDRGAAPAAPAPGRGADLVSAAARTHATRHRDRHAVALAPARRRPPPRAPCKRGGRRGGEGRRAAASGTEHSRGSMPTPLRAAAAVAATVSSPRRTPPPAVVATGAGRGWAAYATPRPLYPHGRTGAAGIASGGGGGGDATNLLEPSSGRFPAAGTVPLCLPRPPPPPPPPPSWPNARRRRAPPTRAADARRQGGGGARRRGGPPPPMIAAVARVPPVAARRPPAPPPPRLYLAAAAVALRLGLPPPRPPIPASVGVTVRGGLPLPTSAHAPRRRGAPLDPLGDDRRRRRPVVGRDGGRAGRRSPCLSRRECLTRSSVADARPRRPPAACTRRRRHGRGPPPLRVYCDACLLPPLTAAAALDSPAPFARSTAPPTVRVATADAACHTPLNGHPTRPAARRHPCPVAPNTPRRGGPLIQCTTCGRRAQSSACSPAPARFPRPCHQRRRRARSGPSLLRARPTPPPYLARRHPPPRPPRRRCRPPPPRRPCCLWARPCGRLPPRASTRPPPPRPRQRQRQTARAGGGGGGAPPRRQRQRRW
ncbi:hypothetical protein BU14_0314s0001 [Porphyra umbilicalis]|uniref:Uncharacterized protein n=1 Tax=Porphyra umbilicalis TaxID=2786 RepID=A0A1X6NZG0_PORUM|nr:hypothetical protein BU14_0314s0001 [Porphyra umbilicalis]|eukprot:OSX73998.1 hypothetical protein BU14_0314s0001 [Porphyra umbilicalis]